MRRVSRCRKEGPRSLQGHLTFFRVLHSPHIRRARPVWQVPARFIALSSFSQRYDRKLRTSFPRGGCPSEIQPIRSTENFPVRLNWRATAAALELRSRVAYYVCVRVSLYGWIVWHIYTCRSRSPASHARTRLPYTHANAFGILMRPILMKSSERSNRWRFDPGARVVLSGSVLCNSEPHLPAHLPVGGEA